MTAPPDHGATATVRAVGRDLDGMGPPAPGRIYLVLEVPAGENAENAEMVIQALASGRIRLEPAP